MQYDLQYIADTAHCHRRSPPHIIEPDVLLNLASDGRTVRVRPRLVIWNPLEQYSMSLCCPHHNVTLVPGKHSHLKGENIQRHVYDQHGVVHILAERYICSPPGGRQQHQVIATDYGIMKQVSARFPLPFVITHRSGCTSALLQYVGHRVMTGTNFHDLEVFLKEEALAFFTQKLAMFKYTYPPPTMPPTAKEVMHFLRYVSPSRTLLRHLYLSLMQNNRIAIVNDLQSLSATNISMDHTFKVATNVGYLRNDNTWVTLYDSLFCVLNEHGHVLAYTLCKDRAFASIKHLLVEIHNRSTTQSKSIQIISIDNCCQWRQQLNGIFGQDVPVKLDLFHAVQRISRTVFRTVTYRTELLRQLRQVFHSSEDSGQCRHQPTPDTDVLLKNFSAFTNYWQDRVSPETQKAFRNLKIHIMKGCLSRIPPGCGTSRNERLHKQLNKSALAVAHIGPELANSLLDGIFYSWNNRKRYGLSKPLTLVQTDNAEIEGHVSDSNNEGQEDVELMESNPHQTRMSTDVVQFANENHVVLHNIHAAWMTICQFEVVTASCDVTKYVHSFFNSRTLFQTIDSTLETINFVAQLGLHSHKEVFNILRDPSQETHPSMYDEVYHHMQAYVSQQMQGDGSVLLIQKNPTYPLLPLIIGGNLDHTTVCSITWPIAESKLPINYSIVTHGTLHPHSKSHVQAQPMNVEPEDTDVEGAAAIGTTSTTYDASHSAFTVEKYCRCGRRSRKSTEACTAVEGNYKSRCPCLQRAQPCGKNCRCFGCKNPYGSHLASHVPADNRRPRFISQRPSSKFMRSDKYLSNAGEEVASGPWTEMETIALMLCIRVLKNTATILQGYNELRKLCLEEKCSQSLRPKKMVNVSSKVKHISKVIGGLGIPPTSSLLPETSVI